MASNMGDFSDTNCLFMLWNYPVCPMRRSNFRFQCHTGRIR